MPGDTDPRLLRAFVAVAEELHFTRAAARLYLAQQALSRDIRRLERAWGVPLFLRTTRQVTLTPDGVRLLPYARRVLAAQDELWQAVHPSDLRPLLVDIGSSTGTPPLVMDEARRNVPELELVARFHSGLTGAAAELAAGRLDVSFGRVAGLDPALRAGLDHLPVRCEPMAVLLPEDHRLARLSQIPLAELAGETLYAANGNAATAEWTDLARRLFAGRGIHMAAPFPEIEGDAEFIRVVRKQRWSVLASVLFIEVPGMVLRPLTEPVPLAPISMVWPRGLRHPGLDALRAASRTLAARHRWLHRPPGSWLPDPDAALLGLTGSGPSR